MILADSSALIEFYRPSGNPRARRLIARAIAAGELAVNGIIQVEILAFARDEAQRRKLAADFRAFDHLPLGRDEFDLAAALGFDLRRQGITVPATDLVIAASAMRAGATLFHLDAHFERIAEHADLAERSLLGPLDQPGHPEDRLHS